MGNATEIIVPFTPSYYVTKALTLIFDGTALSNSQIRIDLVAILVISIIIYVIGLKLYSKKV